MSGALEVGRGPQGSVVLGLRIGGRLASVRLTSGQARELAEHLIVLAEPPTDRPSSLVEITKRSLEALTDKELALLELRFKDDPEQLAHVRQVRAAKASVAGS